MAKLFKKKQPEPEKKGLNLTRSEKITMCAGLSIMATGGVTAYFLNKLSRKVDEYAETFGDTIEEFSKLVVNDHGRLSKNQQKIINTIVSTGSSVKEVVIDTANNTTQTVIEESSGLGASLKKIEESKAMGFPLKKPTESKPTISEK